MTAEAINKAIRDVGDLFVLMQSSVVVSKYQRYTAESTVPEKKKKKTEVTCRFKLAKKSFTSFNVFAHFALRASISRRVCFLNPTNALVFLKEIFNHPQSM